MKDNWYVLFALVAKENKLCSVLRRKGLDAFIPKIEYYRRDIKGNTLKMLFPGYIFVRSEMKQSDFDNLLYELGEQRDGLIKQLKDDGVTALRDEEIEMFNKLLNSEGILEMSQAFIEDNKAKVIYGPLIHYQDHIVKIDKHNRIAVLDIEFLNRHILAGLGPIMAISPFKILIICGNSSSDVFLKNLPALVIN